MAPLFRAEQIGSLLRPAALLAARTKSDRLGTYIQALPEDIQRGTQEAIASAIEKQEELSIRPFTSGEYERAIFYSGMFEKLEGFEVRDALPIPDGFRTNFPSVATLYAKGVKTRPGVVATAKIKHVKSVYGEELKLLQKLLPEEKWKECKLTMPAVTWQHMQ